MAAVMLLGSACQADERPGNIRPVPQTAPEASTTSTTVIQATTTTAPVISEPSTTTTTTAAPESEPAYDWGPVICPSASHPAHHGPCEGTRANVIHEHPSPQSRTVRPASSSSSLAAIRECESGGDYSTNTGNGYYGAYQFDQSTWESVGGEGSPSDASPSEQDMRASTLQSQRGNSPWPTCG